MQPTHPLSLPIKEDLPSPLPSIPLQISPIKKRPFLQSFPYVGRANTESCTRIRTARLFRPRPNPHRMKGIALHFLHYFSANPGSNGGGRVEEKVLQKSPVEGGGRGQGTQYRGERGGSNLLGRRLEKEEEEETERGSFFASRRRRPGPYHCAFLLKSEEQKWEIVQSHWTIS